MMSLDFGPTEQIDWIEFLNNVKKRTIRN
jgi:hypothetical protein